jgi:hypothetical protein
VQAQLDPPAEETARAVELVLPQKKRLSIVGCQGSERAGLRHHGTDDDGRLLRPRRRRDEGQ